MASNSKLNRSNKEDVYVLIGHFIVMALAILGITFQLIRGFDGMEPSWAISTGMEILGLFVNVVVSFSFLRTKGTDLRTRVIFSFLLASSSFCIFCDEIAWLVQSIPKYAVINRVTNAFLYAFSFTVALMFWGYVIDFFKVKSKYSITAIRIYSILWYPAVLIALANIFVPIYFSVDSTGTYQREALYPLHMIYYLIAIPPATITIAKAKVPWTEKLAATTFYIIPILGILLSMVMFGISTSALCTMIPIVLNYFVVISNREKKYAVTKNGIDIATKIQVGILPKSKGAFPDRNDFEIAASMTPALTVGGDFYDFFLLDENHIAILIADVSDKGIPAALFMTISKVFLKTRIENGGTPAEILKYADEQISKENDAKMFVTLWLGVIDLRTGHVEACNAGHDYPAISKLSEGYKIEKTPHGPPIAFIPGMEFPELSFDLNPGESIFLYTDGLIEAKRKDNERFGTDRMLEVLNSSADKNGEEVLQTMKDSVNEFTEDEPQFDDITMLLFTYKGRN